MRSFLTAAAFLALTSQAMGQITEGFEYPDGALAGNGGWEVWYTGGNDGTVVTGAAHGGSKFMQMTAGTDAVHRFNIAGGQWTLSVWTYTPTGSLDGYFIMMNQYGDAATDNWSVQIRFNGDAADPLGNVVESQFDGTTLPIIPDQWIELRVEIDLDADTVNSFYNGAPLGQNLTWTNNVSANGTLTIECIDLYSFSSEGFRWDDLSLQEAAAPCPGDLNNDGVVDLSDLATLLAHFGAAGGPADGDIDGNGVVDLADLAALLGNFGTTC
jgi:hypothetical protein